MSIRKHQLCSTAGFMLHLREFNTLRLLMMMPFYMPFTSMAPGHLRPFELIKIAFSYPEKMPGKNTETTEKWTIENIRQRAQFASDWMAKYRIPATQIVVGEFGVDRRVSGAAAFLADAINSIQ